MLFSATLLATIVAYSASESGVLFKETFDTDPFTSNRWVKSKESKYSHQPVIWNASSSPAPGFEEDKGLLLSEAMKYYGFGIPFAEPVTGPQSADKELVVQYELKLDDKLECGGAYIKLLRDTTDLTKLTNDSPYTIMFGPDKCGGSNKVHFIIQHKNPLTGLYEEKHFKDAPSVKTDKKSHLYTLIIRHDNTFEILIDKVVSKKGDLLTSMDPSINPPEEINDPNDSKPADWVDEAKIDDPKAVKPDDWDETLPRTIPDPDAKKPEGWLDNEPDEIPDPAAVKPEDWDDGEDGVWEAPSVPNPACEAVGCGEWKRPTIKNPAYKGKWVAPKIDNPAYKGPWAARRIPNPAYFNDPNPAVGLTPITALAIEVWTTNEGFLLDNFLVATSKAAALAFAAKTYDLKAGAEEAKEKAARKEQKLKEKEAKLSADATWQTKLSVAVTDITDQVQELIEKQPLPVAAVVVVLLLTLIYLALPAAKSKKPTVGSTGSTPPAAQTESTAPTTNSTAETSESKERVTEVVDEPDTQADEPEEDPEDEPEDEPAHEEESKKARRGRKPKVSK